MLRTVFRTMVWSSYINAKPFLLVTAGLLLTYILAFVTLMIRWMNFWIGESYFLSYQAIFLIVMMISLLWWVRRHHTEALPVLSTILYATVAGYVSGLSAMTLYPIFSPGWVGAYGDVTPVSYD